MNHEVRWETSSFPYWLGQALNQPTVVLHIPTASARLQLVTGHLYSFMGCKQLEGTHNHIIKRPSQLDDAPLKLWLLIYLKRNFGMQKLGGHFFA